MRATAIVALAIAASGCGPHARARQLDRVAKCAAASQSAIPADWKRIGGVEGFAFYLPPSCLPDDAAPRFVHGGDRWKCGTVGVDVVWGMWGRESFGAGDQCRTVLGTVPVLELTRASGERGERRQVVWYLTGVVHEPILSAWSTEPGDAPVIQAITHSGTMLRRSGRSG